MHFLYSIAFLMFLSIMTGEAQKLRPVRKPADDGISQKWGFVNTRDRFVISPVYDTVFFDFHNGIAGVGKYVGDTLYADIIDRKGDCISETAFRSLDLRESYILVESQEFAYGIADLAGNIVEKPIYKSIETIHKDVHLEYFYQWDIYTFKGRLADTFAADSISQENKHLILYRNGHSFREMVPDTLITAGSPLYVNDKSIPDTRCALADSLADSLSVLYTMVLPCQDGLIAVEQNKLYGFIDTAGKIRISIQYEDIKQFSEGLAPVRILGKWGYIDISEDIVIQPFYDDAWSFSNASAKVRKDEKFNFVDKKGTLRNAYGFDSVEENEFGNWYLRLNGKTGLANRQGAEIIIPRYQSLEDWGNGYVRIFRHNAFGVIDYDQNIIVPDKYQLIEYVNSGILAGNPIVRKKINYPLEKISNAGKKN